LVLLPSSALAQDGQVRPSTKLFESYLKEAATPAPKAPSADFGKAAAACAVALGPTSMDVSKLEPAGWTQINKQSTDKSAWVFEKEPSPVRIFMATAFAPQGQCVVDGYALSKGEFGPIAKAVKTQVGAALGAKLSNSGSTRSPNGNSRGQGFVTGKLFISVSSENEARGMNVRVTLMQMDPAKSAFEIANSAGMAALYLPMFAQAPDKSEPTKTSTPQ
jgi:hypothetical protein